ncbi:hypothetical protein IVA86_20245 [Bradyrhizobium sp. 146]|nr:hypothetical protein [Bradyrhizobium sp. 146]
MSLTVCPEERWYHAAELDDQIVREVFWLDLAALLPPESYKRVLIVSHDGPRIRAADEMTAVVRVKPNNVIGRTSAVCLNRCHRYLLRKNKAAFFRRTAASPAVARRDTRAEISIRARSNQ